METPKLEEKMAEFEARARINGIQVVRTREYELLRNEYRKRIEGMSEEDKKLAEKAQDIDKFLRERQIDLTKGEKQRKIAAVGIGMLSIGAFSAGEIAEKFYGTPGAPSAEDLEQAAGATGEKPPLTPEQADSAGVRSAAAGGAETPQAEGAAGAAAAEAAEREAREAAENHISTIKKGEGVLRASRRLVTSGAITEEQWKEAIGNASSKTTLPGGTEIHISELHLVHVGDQVVYVPGEGGAPGHFEVKDYAGDKLNFGNAKDLAEAMKREGHWGHKSHEWLYDKLKEYPEGYKTPESPADALDKLDKTIPEVGLTPSEETSRLQPIGEAVPAGVTPPQEAVEQAARGALEVAAQELSFDWGTARFVLDEQGRIADVLIQETAGLEKRPELVNQAAEELLQSSYVRTLERGVSEDARHLVMPQRIAQAKESAWEVFKFKQLFESITNPTSSEAYFLRYKIKALAGAHELKLDARIFKAFRF